MTGNDIQLDAKGRLKHFLTIEGIDRSLFIEIRFMLADGKHIQHRLCWM